MRDDPEKPVDFAEHQLWSQQRYQDKLMIRNPNKGLNEPVYLSQSLSGNERNRIFLNSGTNFTDLTLISGSDFGEDGRGFVWTDFDQDGLLDKIVISLAEPRVRFMRNETAKLGVKPRSLRLSLVGGNHSASPSLEWSNRDAIGARVTVSFNSGRTVLLQRQAGEGFSVQNSASLNCTWLQGDKPTKLEVQWPSGKTTSHFPNTGMNRLELKERAIADTLKDQ